MFKQNITAKTCQECGVKNPVLFKSCRSCKTRLVTQVLKPISEEPENKIFSKWELLTQIQNGLDYAVSTMNTVSEQVLSFAEKFRWLFLVVQMAKDDCEVCTNFINLLIQTGKDLQEGNNTHEQFIIITEKVNELREHIESYDNEHHSEPDNDSYTLQSLLYGFNIRRNIPHWNPNDNGDEAQYEVWEDPPEDIYQDYNINHPATVEQIALIQPVELENVPNDEHDICPICTENLKFYNESGKYLVVVRLPCGHMYHDVCIMEWLKLSNKCPLGRCPIVSLHGLLEEE